MDVRTFVMMGRPGAGKGTQARLLADHLDFELFSTGAHTRTLAKEDSFVGRKVKELAEEGHLQPHWLGSFFFEQLLLSRPREHGVVFDGTCRKLPEAQLFEEVASWLERPFRAVYLNVSEETILNRLLRRKGIEGRADDAEESIRQRLSDFRNDTEPAVSYLRERGLLIDIEGEGEPAAIFETIRLRIQTP